MKRLSRLAVVLALAAGLPGCATEFWRGQSCDEVAAAVQIRLDGVESLELKILGNRPARFGRFVLTNGSRSSLRFDIWSEPPIAGIYGDSIAPEALVDGKWEWRGDLPHHFRPDDKTIRIPSGDTWVFHELMDGVVNRGTDQAHRFILIDDRGCRIPTQDFSSSAVD